MSARPSRAFHLFVALALILAVAAPANAAPPEPWSPPPTGPSDDAPAVPGQFLVAFDPSLPSKARASALASEHARPIRQLSVPGLTLVELPATASVNAVKAVSARLGHLPGVRYAEPNYIFRTLARPNDPLFDDLWGLDNDADHDIDAPSAWSITRGSRSVVVAVVDSGVDYEHPDLAANIWRNHGEKLDGRDNDHNGFVDDVRGWDFVGDDNSPSDPLGHGTHVAGTIGARGDNGQGISGVNWRVSLMPVRAGNAQGELTNANVVDAFHYACDNGARVVNASFGGSGFARGVRDAIRDCPETLFVVAAGNGGGDGLGDDNDVLPTYPCGYGLSNVVCVGASGRDDQLTSFSNYGARSVDLVAPGERILSATPYRVRLADGFEHSLAGRWTTGGAGIDWARTTAHESVGSHSVTDSPGGSYRNNSNTWLRTADAVTLGSSKKCVLDYSLRADTQSGADFFLVDVAPAKAGPWTTIDGGSGSTGGAFIGFEESLAAFTGSSYLRFRMRTDGTGRADGAYVDDVVVRCLTGTHTSRDFVMFDGTSMATPHVTGVAALILAAHPHLGVASVKRALLDGVDGVASLDGKVVSGGRLNARGALNAVDSIGPDAAPPTQRMVLNSTLGTSTIPLAVSWPAAVDAGDAASGVYAYQLQHRSWTDGAWGSWSTVVPSTAKLSATVSVRGGKQQFRVRAEDRAGNTGSWALGAEFSLSEPRSRVAFDGEWSVVTSSDAYRGSLDRSTDRGATAELSFTGRQVVWVSTRGPRSGRADVYIDGRLARTVDLYAASTRARRLVFSRSWADAETHVLRIRVISKNPDSSGKRVDVDAILVRS